MKATIMNFILRTADLLGYDWISSLIVTIGNRVAKMEWIHYYFIFHFLYTGAPWGQTCPTSSRYFWEGPPKPFYRPICTKMFQISNSCVKSTYFYV